MDHSTPIITNTHKTQWIYPWGLLGFATAGILAKIFQVNDPAFLVALFTTCVALPMIVISVLICKTQCYQSSGLMQRKVSDFSSYRLLLKSLGFTFTIFILVFCYWLFPEYSKEFYYPVWQAAFYVAGPLLLLGVVYMVWVDRRMVAPEDSYYHAGLFVLGRWKGIDWNLLKTHALGWLMKGFFLPFMLAAAAHRLTNLNEYPIQFTSFGHLYLSLFNLLLCIDIVFGATGYLLTLRITDSHIRSVEITWLGWISALMCYQPFSKLTWGSFLTYKESNDWMDWLSPYPILFITWGCSILFLYVIYTWSTTAFGCRFSNLTNRGIISHGPYRYLKHPAYVSKCLSWWLISVPFLINGSWHENIRASICLLLTCGIYAVRAWTEERHLMKDPDYQAYSTWMSKNGLFAPMSNKLRIMIPTVIRKLAHEN
jgi:protein-S-isoprenylcysteine O-methyltransferase Ste14